MSLLESFFHTLILTADCQLLTAIGDPLALLEASRWTVPPSYSRRPQAAIAAAAAPQKKSNNYVEQSLSELFRKISCAMVPFEMEKVL